MRAVSRRISPFYPALLALAALAQGGCTPERSPSAATPVPTEAPSKSDPAASRDARLGAWIEAYVSAFGKSWGEGYAFSGCLAVLRDGEIVFGKAYGKADRGTGAVADRDTRFRIGSLTKQLTAAAVLTLAEQGKIALDDPIVKHLRESPAAWSKITIHHLLTHTSGIPSYTSNAQFMKERDKPKKQAQLLAELYTRPLDFEPPGSRFVYSNSGYYLLGVLIEKVGGATYEAYLKEHVLGPAGMLRTSVEAPSGEPNSAVGYTVDETDSVVPAHAADMSIPFAAGALRSTVNDLAAWDRALSGARVLGQASIQRMFTVEKGDYGYGFFRSRFAGHDVASHTGRIDVFTAYYARALDTRVSVIALSNNDMFEARQVASAALEMALTGERKEPPSERAVVPVDPAFAARVSGEYRLSEESRAALAAKVPKEIIDSAVGMTISQEGDRLFMKPSGQQRVRVFLGTDGVLFTKQDPLELSLSPQGDTASPVRSITLSQGGTSGRYDRVAPP